MSWFSAESAKNRIAASFEVAGGALNDLASSAARQRQQQDGQQTQASTSTSDSNGDATSRNVNAGDNGGATVVKLPPKAGGPDANSSNTTNSNAPVAVAVAGGQASTLSSSKSSNNPAPTRKNQFSSFMKNINSEKWLANTQKVLERTATVVQNQTQNIQNSLNQPRSATGIRIRDPSLPLDTDALRDAEVVYITDRIVTLGHPAMQSPSDPDITAPRKLAAVGQLMNKRHLGKYMVWNLSEVEYDYSLLNEQVLAYKFPGSPSPPLGLLLKLIFSMESWLRADPKNVAVLHCLTGKGRTSTVLACFLCWTGEAGFNDPLRALEYIALCKRCEVDQLTIPSQRRYVTYFSNMLDGVRPHHPPLILKRVILSDAPKYEKDPNKTGDEGGQQEGDSSDTLAEMGCSPYVQLFKAGNLILTAAPTLKAPSSSVMASETSANGGGAGTELPFCLASDGSATFIVESIIQGDILIRCRHLSQRGQRVSMFRAAFHTGYTPPKVMRLSKAQLDGACTDRRFADDFFVDLVFEACDATEASKHLLKSQSSSRHSASSTDEAIAATKVKVMEAEAENSLNEASARRARGAVETSECAKSDVGVSATTYDTMLHRDGRFWEAIAARRQENMKRVSEMGVRSGPTIGRRRNSNSMKGLGGSRRGSGSGGAGDVAKDQACETNGAGGGDQQMPQETSARSTGGMGMDAFSIGGGDFDFGSDFGGDASAVTAQQPTETSSPAPAPAPPKKDDLMDALMALDSDDDYDEEEEDIVFTQDEDDAPAEPQEQEPPQQQTEKKAAAPEKLEKEVAPVAEVTPQQGPTPPPQEDITASSTKVKVPAEDTAVPPTEVKAPAAEDVTESAEVKAPAAPVSTPAPAQVAEEAAPVKEMESRKVDVPKTPSPEITPIADSTPAPVPTPAPEVPTAVPAVAPTPEPSAEPKVEDKTTPTASTDVAEDGDDADDDDLGLDDLDNEIDALMGGDGDGGDGDDEEFDFDDDDEDLEDLEAFLSA